MLLDGTRFVQHPLGNPVERGGADAAAVTPHGGTCESSKGGGGGTEGGGEFPVCNRTSRQEPLALIWSRTGGVTAAGADPSEFCQWLADLGAQWQGPGGRLRKRERSSDT